MKSTNREKAFVLIIAVSVLLLLSTFAVSFTRLSTMDRHTVTSYVDSVIADMHGSAGIDLAIANLIVNFENDIYYKDYLCTTVDPVSTTVTGIDLLDDETAAGVPIEDLQIFNTNNVNRPSYTDGTIIGETNVSGTIQSDQSYTLKVFDTDSQININSDLKFLDGILMNLAEGIKMRKFGPNEKDYNNHFANIESQKLGELIVSKRQPNGYQTKDAIVGLNDNIATINQDNLEALSDFITAYPLPPTENEIILPFFRQSTFDVPGDKSSEVLRFIPAVNINTTSWCVLYALCKDIKFNYKIDRVKANADPDVDNAKSIDTDISAQAVITTDDARRFANFICTKRKETVFKNYQEFADFIDQNKNEIFKGQGFSNLDTFLTDNGFSENQKNSIKNRLNSTDADFKAEAVKANFNPIATKKSVFSKIHKADLEYHTIGFSFFTSGHFEITCLAQTFLKNNPVVAKKYCSNVRVFDIIVLDSQEDFENTRIGDFVADSFSAPNNLQNIANDNARVKSSNTEGVIDPIQLNARMNTSALDNPGPDGNYLFKADFNGTIRPNTFTKTLPSLEPVQSDQLLDIEQNNGGFVPRSGNPRVDLAAEGFTLKSGDPEEKLVFADHTVDLTNSENNFVKDDRSLMFWFKISDDWEEDGEFRTVFFSNTNIVKELNAVKYVIGLQREVQMAIDKGTSDVAAVEEDQDDNRKRRKRKGKKDKSIEDLRNLEIKFTNSLFVNEVEEKADGKIELKPVSDETIISSLGFNGNDIKQTSEIFSLPNGVNIHPEEFYHLALQWRQAIDIPTPSFLTVTGQFYSPKGIPIIEEVPQFNTDTTDGKGAFQIANKNLSPKEPKKDNTSIRDEFVNLNETESKMYIGEPGNEAKPEIVIDDVRITNDISWINDINFLPSRYKLGSTPDDNFFGEFQMQINAPGSNKILFVIPEIIRTDNKTALTSDGNLIIDDRTKVEDQLEEEFGISAESFPNLNELLTSVSILELTVTRKGNQDEMEIKKGTRRLFRFRFPASAISPAQNNQVLFQTTGTLPTILNAYLTNQGRDPIDFSTQLDVTLPNKNISEFQAILPENQIPGQPINVTFRFQRIDEKPIFQSPLLDKVTFAFVGKPKILEYTVQER